MRLRVTVLLVTAVIFAALPRSAAAQACIQLTWGETKTRAFVFTYQAAVPLGAEIAEAYGRALDEEFNRFSNLFETTLPVPIMVRVYPSERDYYCYNALAPQIPLGQTHSHIGGREIALIAQNIQDDFDTWQAAGLDALRGELAVLFLNYVSADKAPEGLQLGLNIYAQDPFVTFEPLLVKTRPPAERPSVTWRSLWDSPDPVGVPDQAAQAASIIAYLVDVYGWESLVEFAGALRTSESWRPALESVYPASANALENQWAEAYYPRFIAGRWRENALYSLSLTPYEQLIAAGAYQAAADGLANVIELLVELEDFDRLVRAQELNEVAFRGLEADAAARQARQAYLEGDFNAAKGFAGNAIQAYIDLADVRNLQTLLVIERQAAEVIELNTELDSIESKSPLGIGLAYGRQLEEISDRLQSLGDAVGAQRTNTIIDAANLARRRIGTGTALAGALAACFFLFLRMRRLREIPPPEARLQSG